MKRRPNILWLYCDELRADALGCYGGAQVPVQTPHLDRLASQGARFTRNYCNSPICVASRTSILTGLYPEQTGVYSNEGSWRNFKHDPGARTFPQVFADAGYVTATFGKSHVPASVKPWQMEDTRGGGMDACDGAMAEKPWADVPLRKRCGTIPVDVAYGPSRVADNAIRFMQAQRGSRQPWLVRASWLQPHTPVLPPAPWGDMYMHCEVDLGAPDLSTLSLPERLWVGERPLGAGTPEQMRAVHLRYYGLSSWMDSQVGQVLAALEALGEAEQTIVIFTSDHGCFAGNWGITGKHLFQHWSHRVPLIYRFPGRIGAGAVREDLCESLDLACTLFALAGIEPNEDHFRGRDLFSDPEPEAVFGTIGYGYLGSRLAPNVGAGAFAEGRGWPRRTCVRTRAYRFEKSVLIEGRPVAADEADPLLVVCGEDPDEKVNRAYDPSLREVVARLSALIDGHAADSVEVPPAYVAR